MCIGGIVISVVVLYLIITPQNQPPMIYKLSHSVNSLEQKIPDESRFLFPVNPNRFGKIDVPFTLRTENLPPEDFGRGSRIWPPPEDVPLPKTCDSQSDNFTRECHNQKGTLYRDSTLPARLLCDIPQINEFGETTGIQRHTLENYFGKMNCFVSSF